MICRARDVVDPFGDRVNACVAFGQPSLFSRCPVIARRRDAMKNGAMPRMWKPCDDLVPSDFDAYPIWTFDLSQEGDDPDADETWVRPLGHKGFRNFDDCLFVRTKVTGRDGSDITGCIVCIEAGGGQPLPGSDRGKKLTPKLWNQQRHVTSLIRLKPKYVDISVSAGPLGALRFSEGTDDSLLGSLRRRLPLTYEVDVPLAGRKRLVFSGTLDR